MFDEDKFYEEDDYDPYEEAWNDDAWENQQFIGSNDYEYYDWDEEVWDSEEDYDEMD